jgi:NADH:ubiquinone oxidoreductase subunit E
MTTRPADEADAALAAVLARHGGDRHALLQMLVDLQDRLGWLPRRTLGALADALALPLGEVEGVAGFYRFLHLQPVGRWRLLFSDNVIDRQAGSRELMTRLCQRLRVAPGVPREDGRVSVATTSCIGLVDQGPSLLVNHRQVLTHLSTARIERIAELVETDTPLGQWPADWSRVDDVVRRADEGEPGTFKDRTLLRHHAHALFDGMGIAAYVLGARRGFLYLRGEYRWLLDGLLAVLAERRQAGLLGSAILGQAGFDFDIAVHLGAGAYVCGEESALIESLEGHRGTAHPPALPGRARLPRAADGGQQRRDLLRRGPHRPPWLRLVGRHRHPAEHRHQDPFGQRRLRAAGAVRIPLRHAHGPRAGGLRCARHPGGAGGRAVGRVHLGLRIRPQAGFRGRVHRRRLHGLRPLARPVRGRARLR